MGKTLPQRTRLPHDIPSWVEDGAIYYITVCALPRNVNHLATSHVAESIRSTMHFYQDAGRWWVHLLTVMPDHVHALISFAREQSMRKTVSDWKKYVARINKIDWQRDFFDHRLRRDESFDEKAYYIRMNPVRANLVSSADNWPYVWTNPTPR